MYSSMMCRVKMTVSPGTGMPPVQLSGLDQAEGSPPEGVPSPSKEPPIQVVEGTSRSSKSCTRGRWPCNGRFEDRPRSRDARGELKCHNRRKIWANMVSSLVTEAHAAWIAASGYFSARHC